MSKNDELRNMLLQLDRQFNRETAIGGVHTWVSYFSNHGVMVVSEGENIKGREAILEYMNGPFSLPEFSLSWEPDEAIVSEDGTLGYTYGNYIRTYRDVNGNNIISKGKYTSIWQKQRDNDWKIVLDIGT